MIDTDFIENLKRRIDEVKEKTLDKLLAKDAHYQMISDEQGFAEKKYFELELTEYQREVVDNLLGRNDDSNMEYSTLSYLAGLIDRPKIQEILQIDLPSQPEDTSAIRDLYNGNTYPSENMTVSNKSRKLLKKIHKKEKNFKVELSPIQQDEFQRIMENRTQLYGYDIENSFVSGFQYGTKLILEALHI